MPIYTCPSCRTKLQSEKEAKPGQFFRCPECDERFSPRAEVLAFQDDEEEPRTRSKPRVKTAAKPQVKPKAAAPAPPPPPPPDNSRYDDSNDDDPGTYGVVQETAEEIEATERNKPQFGAIRDKFKKSARGPASSRLVMPSNLLLGQGSLMALIGLGFLVLGMWPIIFTDVPNSDEEFAENLFNIVTGISMMIWGSITCYGAVQMVTLGSYGWSFVGAVFGLVPLPVGILGIITLHDKIVLEGFAEPETGPIQTESDEQKQMDEDAAEEEEEEEEEEEDDDDYDDEPQPRKRRR